jgi:hypothetical protein
MRALLLAVLLLTPAAAIAQEARQPFQLPQIGSQVGSDWFAAGSRPRDYDMGVETGAPETLIVKAKPGAATGQPNYGTFMQMRPPGPLLGKRVRLSGRVKTDRVPWATIWLRVDAEDTFAIVNGKRVNNKPPLAFNNMSDRPIRGTTNWERYELVLDVPENATAIAYGLVLLGGKGTAWAENLDVEVVDKTVPVSVMGRRAPWEDAPWDPFRDW